MRSAEILEFRQNALVDSTGHPSPRLLSSVRNYWSDLAARRGFLVASGALAKALWEFLRDSTPARLRQRYGDADYDWDHRVNTTSAAVAWRDRLLGVFHSPYQPTESGLFHEMLEDLQRHTNLNFSDFTFIDLGSGKGRTLLMACDYPFRRIVGVELLPSLHEIAKQNLLCYKSDAQKCFALESVCADATIFPLPNEPLVLFLFNPFPESGLRRMLRNLKQNLEHNPRPAYVLYHNPELQSVVEESGLKKVSGTHQYAIFAASN